MRRVIFFPLIVLILFSATGCAADLVVTSLDVDWDESNKKARAEIANIGNEDAGEFMVYFNGDENPISSNRRPQVSHGLPGLTQGDSVVLESDFVPLAHPDNSHLGNVHKVTVLVDPKNMVRESNENNNNIETSISLPDLVVVDIFQDGTYIYVSYMNNGEAGSGDFLIKMTNNNTNDTYEGNSYYRFPVPPPNILQMSGGLTPGIIGVQLGASVNANITAEIDWERRVSERNENNNIFTKDML